MLRILWIGEKFASMIWCWGTSIHKTKEMGIHIIYTTKGLSYEGYDPLMAQSKVPSTWQLDLTTQDTKLNASIWQNGWDNMRLQKWMQLATTCNRKIELNIVHNIILYIYLPCTTLLHKPGRRKRKSGSPYIPLESTLQYLCTPEHLLSDRRCSSTQTWYKFKANTKFLILEHSNPSCQQANLTLLFPPATSLLKD